MRKLMVVSTNKWSKVCHCAKVLVPVLSCPGYVVANKLVSLVLLAIIQVLVS